MAEFTSRMDNINPVEPLRLPPEVEEGNIEYKLKLIQPSASRLEHLVSQMKWRLQEGNGEAIYEIGVEDSGYLAGLNDQELCDSMETLTKMACRLGASVTILRERQVQGPPNELVRRRTAEVLIRRIPEDQQFIDIRVAVLGNADAGKSTLLGVLTHGELDNGRGQARLNLFRHLHEIQSGRTSSISDEILGFAPDGQTLTYNESRSAADICEQSSKLINFIDLAGHPKYLKTTISGLTSHMPEFVMLVVSASQGISHVTREHLGFALALHLPVFCVVTKTDACRPAVTERTVDQLEKTLKSPGCNKVPFQIRSHDDVVLGATQMHPGTSVTSVAPILFVSSVTGDGLGLLHRFLFLLPPTRYVTEEDYERPFHFQIDAVFCVPHVGTVVSGCVLSGSIKENDSLLCGPSDSGQYSLVTCQSIHRNRRPCRLALTGQTVSLALGSDMNIRKGMILTDPITPAASGTCYEFDAEIFVLFHGSSITRGCKSVIYIGSIRQGIEVISITRPSLDNTERSDTSASTEEVNAPTCSSTSVVYESLNELRTNESAFVRVRFLRSPEFVRPNCRFLIRDGNNKCIGIVTGVVPLGSQQNSQSAATTVDPEM